MPKEFRLPDIGEGVAEGEITKWLVEEGQEVREDQPMVEVMTDKVTVEIPSPFRGVVLKRMAPEGATVKVGDVLVVVGEPGEAPGKGPTPSPMAPARAEPPAAKLAASTSMPGGAAQGSPSTGGRVIATPAVRKLAREMGVEMSQVRGTGPHGRITEDDVRAFAASPRAPRPRVDLAGEAVPSRPTAPATTVAEERIPIRGVRKRIWEHMARSEQYAAPFTYVDEVDVTDLVALREKSRAAAESEGVKLTYLPFIIKAVVAGLKEYPTLNARVDEEKQEVILLRRYNVGIATATDEGLIVPVVKDADQRSILDLGREIERLSAAAREGKLQLQDVQGPTFTITSLGAMGGLLATPIISHPEVAILGIHEIRRRPIVDDHDNIVIRSLMNISCTFDHRIIDGHVGAAFTKAVGRYLTNPTLLLLRGV